MPTHITHSNNKYILVLARTKPVYLPDPGMPTIDYSDSGILNKASRKPSQYVTEIPHHDRSAEVRRGWTEGQALSKWEQEMVASIESRDTRC